jgi:hypothetical protein
MSKKKTIEPHLKGLYAWNSIHAGSFLLYVKTLKDCYQFIFLPGPSEYYLTFEDFETSVRTNILEFVEQLPQEVYDETVLLSLSCPT